MANTKTLKPYLIQNMVQDRILQLLQELLKNSKRSDRDLAKILGVSQPTLTRMRRRLERESYILDYTAIPNLAKLGFEIIAFTFLNVDKYDQRTGELNTLGERVHRWLNHHSKIIYATGGEGLEGKNCLLVSFHRDFTDFSEFTRDLRAQWTPHIRNMDSFLVSTEAKMSKRFSFRNLEMLL